MVNDLFMNTSSTIKVALDYAVVNKSLNRYVLEMDEALRQLKNDPVSYYETYKAKQEVFLLTLRLELGYMEDLCKAINESNIQRFWIFLDEKNEIKFDGEKTFNTFSTCLNEALEGYYNIAVAPYRE